MLFCLHRRFSSFFAAAAIATAALSAAQTLQQRPAAKAAPAVEPMPLQVDGKPELPEGQVCRLSFRGPIQSKRARPLSAGSSIQSTPMASWPCLKTRCSTARW